MKTRIFSVYITRVVGFAKKNKLFHLMPVLIFILGDVLLFPASSDVRIFGILFLFVCLIKLFKLTSSTTFLFSLILLVISYVLFISTDPLLYYKPVVPAAERFSVWLYLFLVIGVIQKWKE